MSSCYMFSYSVGHHMEGSIIKEGGKIRGSLLPTQVFIYVLVTYDHIFYYMFIIIMNCGSYMI